MNDIFMKIFRPIIITSDSPIYYERYVILPAYFFSLGFVNNGVKGIATL